MIDIKLIPDNELRELANACELDLLQAAQLAPNGERHVECYTAMHTICCELDRRGLMPQAIGQVH